VIAGPWQMGKVDQGVFTHWALSHRFERPLSYIGFGGSGKQVRDLLHVDDLTDLLEEQLLAPEAWRGATYNVGGGRAGSLSLLETTELCRELSGVDLTVGSVAETRAGDVPRLPVRLHRAAAAHGLAPQARSASGHDRHLRLDRRPRRPARQDPMTPICIVTGSGGLIGSESVRHFSALGFDVVGLENDMRARFFGPESSTAHVTEELRGALDSFRSVDLDIRDTEGVDRLFAEHGSRIEVIVHTAAQPSHDWAALEPHTDFTVNATAR
jgi:nucleoside-diphosphate-sugar epimerase